MMRQRLIFLLMILALSEVCFGQTEVKNPYFVIDEFWNSALENNLENAKRLVLEEMRAAEGFEPVAEKIELIAVNKIKIKEIISQGILGESAFFEVLATDKAGAGWDVNVLLKKEKNQWKILYLSLRERKVSPIPEEPRLPPRMFPQIVPRQLNDYQIIKDCPKCT